MAFVPASAASTPPYFPRPGNHTRQRPGNGHWYFGLFQSLWCRPHQRLLNKLSHYGTDGSCPRWIKSFLSGRTQKVMVDGTFSNAAPIVNGVPQGTVLGPLLFLLFINGLPSTTSPGTRIRLFADDCLIHRPIRNSQDQVTLQHDLDNLIR